MKHGRLFAAAALLSLLAVPAAFAQASVGLKAGLSVSRFSTDFGDTKWRNGAAGGIVVTMPLASGFSFAPELLYVRKGATLTSTNVTVGGIPVAKLETGFDLDYVELPLMLRWSPPSPGPASIFFAGGPTVSVKANEAFTTSGVVGYSFGTDQAKSTDFGVAVGAGAGLKSGGIRWTLEGRWEFGLANISSLPFGGDVKNSGGQVLLGAEFPLGVH